jgi:hypothetical protein
MTNETPEFNTPPSLPGTATTASAEQPPPTVGYCRACGLSLSAATVRQAMGTLYCAEHLPAHTGATPGATPGPTATADNPYASPYAMPPQALAANPDVNPGLAFGLGLIPGVGAIYNGQYAKGLVHAIVFGLLASLTDGDLPLAGLFGFLLPVFVFYMAFEAYHTAKLRRSGQAVDEFSSIVPADKRASAFPLVPVFLIGAGVLFLLINFEVVSLRYLIRLWPAGLIVLGAYMLWDRMNSRSTPTGGFPDVQ